MEKTEVLLRAVDVEKSFSGVRVLKKVGLEILRGEIHALMGENGAGKSTLIKILTGVYPRDGGQVFFRGREVSIETRKDAAELGIAVIYQELSLIPTLTVAQNILLGHESSRGGLLRTKYLKKKAADLIAAYGFSLNPDAAVETLTIGQRQLVEILKALSQDSSLLVMDEPTASLSSSESENLFRTMEVLRQKGVSILYISHRLEEVYRLADRLTVLRDGEVIAVLPKEAIHPAEVIRLMIGKELTRGTKGELRPSLRPLALKVRGLSRRGLFEDVSFDVHEGEILGLGGLVGSGRTEILRCLFGADPYDAGSITFHDQPLPRSVQKNIQAGLGLVPEDRRGQGLVPLLSIRRNVALANFDLLRTGGAFLRDSSEMELCLFAMEKLDVRPRNSEAPVSHLSGGNQQKVVLGKWLARDLKILLVDEPTAGIDVGVKEEIYAILERIASEGVVVVLVSSDLQELLRVSQRILILRRGRIFEEFREGEVTQEDLLRAMSGIEKETAS